MCNAVPDVMTEIFHKPDHWFLQHDNKIIKKHNIVPNHKKDLDKAT